MALTEPTLAQREAHKLAIAQAECQRQVSKAANNTAAGHLAADQIYYAAVLASARANNFQTNARAALERVQKPDWTGQAGD